MSEPIRIYVAGPMSGLPELNFPAFHAAAQALRERGYEVINPAEINVDPATGWHACMRADIRELVTCNALALLPGWQGSKGANIERRLAVDLGLWVLPLERWLSGEVDVQLLPDQGEGG